MTKSEKPNDSYIFKTPWAGWLWEVLWESVDKGYITEETLGGIIDIVNSGSEEDLKLIHEIGMMYHTRICLEKSNTL